MRVSLLGTGSADGWPNPFCDCPSCAAARDAGVVRGQTSVLVDDAVLIDCGPEVPRSAERLGTPLSGVRLVLLTHAHIDHAGRSPLLWRSWALARDGTSGPGPLHVAGPQEAVAVFLEWVGDGAGPRTTALRAGETLTWVGDRGSYEVRALAADHDDPVAGPGLLYDLTGPDGSRLLYATDTGPLPADTVAACTDARYDLVLLEETFGHRTGHGTRHLDLPGFRDQVARLRDVGAVVAAGPTATGTTVVAVHLSHHNPAPDLLAEELARCGAVALPDGTTLELPLGPTRRVLVTGGVRSGKSRFAESLLAGGASVTYVATADPATQEADEDWRRRLAAHRARRPHTWTTRELEAADDLVAALGAAGPSDALLIDDLGNWLSRTADESGAWSAEDSAEVDDAIAGLVAAWRACRAGGVVAVTNEVGDGVVPAHRSGRLFRDWLGRLNAELAAQSDDVVLVTVGVPTYLRGGAAWT